MPDMKEFNDSKKLEEIVSAINEQGAISAEEVREIIAALLEQNKISIEQSDSAQETTNSLKELINSSSEMVETTKEQNDSLNSLSAAAEAQSMAASNGSDSSKPIVDAVHSLGSYLKSMVTLARKADKAETKNSRFFKKLGSVLTKKKDKETTVAKSSNKKEGKGGGVSLDAKTMAKGIGSAISGAITKILSPVALVKAFFTELFPILITVGILLYAFITGWFDGDLIDVIMVLVGIIIVAYLAYLAWTMIKDMIVHGIKIACEFLKVAIEAAADWAAVYVIIAVIAVIAVAFLIAAALIIVIIGLALVGIVLAVWLITKVITSMIEDMTEKIMGIMEEQFSALEDMIVSVVSTFAVLVPMLCDLMTDVAEELEDGISDALSGIWMTFQMMTYTMETLSNEIQRIFNGLVAAILASFLGKAVKQTEEQAADITIEALNADFKIGGMLSAMIADIIGTGFTDMLSEVTESALDSLDDLIDTMADFVDDIADSAYYAMMQISDVISDMGDAAINTIYEMGIAVVVGVWQLVGTFMAILFTMPLVGLMMGLVGNNSFSEAIQPLVAQTEIIVSLLAAIVANNTMLKSQQAVPYSMTNVTEGDNYGDNSSLTTIGQTDGTHIIESPTNYTHREDAGISDEDMISNANFEKYMKAILRALAPVTQKNEKSRGFFADIF